MFAALKTFVVRASLLAAAIALAGALSNPVQAQERKTRVQAPVPYPEIAKRMNVTGTVRVEVTIAADGVVKEVKPIGGHPLLLDAAMDSIKKWRYEAGAGETTQLVIVHFRPNA